MTGNIKLFKEIKFEKGGPVTFGDNRKGKVIGHGTIGAHPKPSFHNVLLVVGLKHNLPLLVNYVVTSIEFSSNLSLAAWRDLVMEHPFL
ncbi:hypothetical protein LINPERPRIM_LOCUS35296 [Linum perenne]